MPVPWLTSSLPAGLSGLADLLDAVEPFALLQVLQAKLYHAEALKQEKELHKEALHEAADLHRKEMTKAQELTQKELQEANRLHGEALHQAEAYHIKEQSLAREIMDRDHELNNYLHNTSMWAQRLLHSDNKKYTLKLFKKELEHAQNVSRKENIRDTLVQESQRAQAIMIVDTLMFGCCFGVLIEGALPEETDNAVVVAFSLTLTIALAFLVVSVWFAMNLQSRITKYRISDPRILYGKKKRQHRSFRSYFNVYCKPVYRLTHAFMWFGTVALLINGSILIAAKFAITHKSPMAASLFILVQSLCILVMASLLWVYNPKLNRHSESSIPEDGEEDWVGYKDFVSSMEKDIVKQDSECSVCRLPVDMFEYCPVSGTHHHRTATKCPHCSMTSFKFCPATGLAHDFEQPGTVPTQVAAHNPVQEAEATSSDSSSDGGAGETINSIMQTLHHPNETTSVSASPTMRPFSPKPNTRSRYLSPSSPYRLPTDKPPDEPYHTVQSPHGTIGPLPEPQDRDMLAEPRAYSHHVHTPVHIHRTPPSPVNRISPLVPTLSPNLSPRVPDLYTPPLSPMSKPEIPL